MKLRSILIGVLCLGFVALSVQWAKGGNVKAEFDTAEEAEAAKAAAEAMGQGNGAVVDPNPGGKPTLMLPNVAIEIISDVAIEMISEHASNIDISMCRVGFTNDETCAQAAEDLIAEANTLLMDLTEETRVNFATDQCTGESGVEFTLRRRGVTDLPGQAGFIEGAAVCIDWVSGNTRCQIRLLDAGGNDIDRTGVACTNGCARTLKLFNGSPQAVGTCP